MPSPEPIGQTPRLPLVPAVEQSGQTTSFIVESVPRPPALLSPREPSPISRRRGAWLWRLLAAVFILGAAALNFAYLAYDCPVDLAPDEAHYWDWSRHLDWSYYSKGPLVAYMIRGSCELFEPWSQQLTGNGALAVRLPAVLCGSLLLLALYVLTVQVFGREPLAALVVLAALTLPLFVAGSSLMTIDAPYTCCWAWAMVLCHRAIFRGSSWAWPAVGAIVALGILAKYTMVLWFPSVGLFLLTSAEHRRLLWQRGFWTMTAVASLAGVPILAWNLAHDWVSVRHVNALAGGSDSHIYWLGPLAYLGTQCAVLLVFWFFAWVRALIAHRPTIEADAGVRYLWWLSLPTFVVFLLFSPKTGGGEANWPAAAYLSGLVLTTAWLARQFQTNRRWSFLWTTGSLTTTCLVGLLLSGVMHQSQRLYPVLSIMAGPPSLEKPLPLRQFDPSCRLRGWRTLAAEVDQVCARLRAEGTEPVLVGTSWSLPGELGFYCAGHPEVYSIGLAVRDRRSQYDLWRPNPTWDPEQFRGRTFVVIGVFDPTAMCAFDVLEEPKLVTHCEKGQPINAWHITVCRGFHGFAPVEELLTRQRF